MTYNRDAAITYARKWAFGRNPQYGDFQSLGGDCTNFVSQCLYSGCGIMNYTRDTGWYYRSLNDRAAGWCGVEYLFRFLTGNLSAGPYATEIPLNGARPGDIIQLCFDGVQYGHSLFIVGMDPELLVATHSDDALDRPLRSYRYQAARLLRIQGVRG